MCLILFHGFWSGVVDFGSHSFWMCQLIKLVRGKGKRKMIECYKKHTRGMMKGGGEEGQAH